MATTSNTYTGNGTNKLFSITFPYLATSDIDVYLNGVLQTITTEYTFANATTVEFVIAPANGAVVLLDRSTDDSTLQATFFPGSSIKANDLNFNFDQVLYLAQETANSAANQSTAGLQTQITAATNTANAANTTANTANVTANAANTTANGIAGTANTALTTANAAEATANGIAATANTALANSTAAVATANTALPLAGGTMTGNLNTPSLNGGPLAGFRNRIINGNMLWTQRYGLTSPTFGVGAAYILDRWVGNATIAGNMRVGRSSDAPVGFVTSQKVDAVTGATIGAATAFSMSQRIEGPNVNDLGFGTANASTVTVSFWVKSSISGTHSASLRNNNVTRSYPFTYAIAVPNTWEKKSITIPGDITGTWNTDSTTGIDLTFDLGHGSTFRSTAGAWTAGNFAGVTGAVSVMATAGANWFITGVQLEPGSVATPFERLDLGTQLTLCQRYYAALSSADTLPVTAFTDQARGYFKLPVTMRVAPTCTIIYDAGGGASFAVGLNGGYQSSGSSTISGFSVKADAEL